MNQESYTARRDQRFFRNTQTALKDIEERLQHLPPEECYAGAYGVLKGYFESLLTNSAETFTSEQLAEIRIALDQLDNITGENEDLPAEEKQKRDQ